MNPEPDLIKLLFSALRPVCRRSRARILSDGREICTGAAYERRRRQVLQRDGFRCVRCGSDYDVAVHHRRKRSLWRDDRLDNLETLCSSCHSVEHRE